MQIIFLPASVSIKDLDLDLVPFDLSRGAAAPLATLIGGRPQSVVVGEGQ